MEDIAVTFIDLSLHPRIFTQLFFNFTDINFTKL